MQGTQRWEGLPSLRGTLNSPTLLAQLIEEGIGIGPLPDQHVIGLRGECRLVRVMPDWCLPDSTGWAVMPGRRLMLEKTRVFFKMLEAELATLQPPASACGQA